MEETGHKKLTFADSGKQWNATDDLSSSTNDTNLSKQGEEILRFGIDSQNIEKNENGYTIMLPDKKLVSFGIGKTVSYISFLNGGFIANGELYIIRFTEDSIIDYWHSAPTTPIKNKKDVIIFISSNCL